jgi:DNA-binding transcriptional ArsR family regulator
VTGRLRIVAEPTRVKILWRLESARDGATVQEIADAVGGGYQNVSRHLGVLFGAGIVSRDRDGNTVRYMLRDWTALWVIERMTDSVGAQLEEDSEEFAA